MDRDRLILSKDKLWQKFRDSAKGLTTPEEVERELDEDDQQWEKKRKQRS